MGWHIHDNWFHIKHVCIQISTCWTWLTWNTHMAGRFQSCKTKLLQQISQSHLIQMIWCLLCSEEHLLSLALYFSLSMMAHGRGKELCSAYKLYFLASSRCAYLVKSPFASCGTERKREEWEERTVYICRCEHRAVYVRCVLMYCLPEQMCGWACCAGIR